MPRALTEQEKCRLCSRLLEKGKEIVLTQGIRKVSVDEITRAAGMAKGSFYQHYDSKEKYLYDLIMEVQRQMFEKAEQTILGYEDFRASFQHFIMSLFHMPEMVFFVKNYDEINELNEVMSYQEQMSAIQTEVEMYENLLLAAGIDTEKAKPGVVNNYLHTLYIAMSSDLMIPDNLPETIDLLIDGLKSYIFGDTK